MALSRVRSLEGLSLECPFDASDIKVDEVVSAYYDDIEDVLRDNKS